MDFCIVFMRVLNKYEKSKLGGTCLNRGCVPTKSLLHSANTYAEAKKFEQLGLTVDNVRYDMEKIHERKAEVVETIVNGVKGLLEANKIDVISGVGKIIEPHKVELASFYSALGCRVTIVEAMDRLPANLDKEFGQSLSMLLKKRGVRIYCSSMVSSIEQTEEGLTCNFKRKEKVQSVTAEAEGQAVVEMICGNTPEIVPAYVPSCIYTEPEIVTVGLTATEASASILL